MACDVTDVVNFGHLLELVKMPFLSDILKPVISREVYIFALFPLIPNWKTMNFHLS